MTVTPPIKDIVRRRFLDRLTPLRAPDDRQGTTAHGTASGLGIFGYCVRRQERVARSRLEHPSLVVVLSGTKEIWRGDLVQRFAAGEPFLIPAGIDYDLVNIPDDRTGLYESLCITIDPVLRQRLQPSLRLSAARPLPNDLAVPLTSDLVEAYGHAATALSDTDPAMTATIARHRVCEILLLISRTPVGAYMASTNLAEQVEILLASDPGRKWRTDEVARTLGIGNSTLRRQLAQAGSSFRHILLRVRMNAAAELLKNDHSVIQAAQASGYTSRSHFARQMNGFHGLLPRQLRHAADPA